MSLSPVEQRIGSLEDLSSLSVEELAELCYEQQSPDFHMDESSPIGYIAQGAEFTIENLVDIRPALSEFYRVRNDHEYRRALGKLMLRRKLAQAAAAKEIPEGSTPVFKAAREFKNIFDLQTGKWRPYNEFFHILDRRVVDSSGRVVIGSESRKYELRQRYDYLGQEGQKLSGERLSAHFTAGYPPELSPYDYLDDRPDPQTALISENELRALLIKWGELDRPVQLELEAV